MDGVRGVRGHGGRGEGERVEILGAGEGVGMV